MTEEVSDTTATPESAESASSESTLPAADDVLSAPDPWDEVDTLSERSAVTTDAATEAAHTDDELATAESTDPAAAAPCGNRRRQ